MQALPEGSYYQIIGFGSFFKKYDKYPREYKQENIEESIKLIKSLDANFKGTNIYKPLQNIYESKRYKEINLERKIFILTDGEVDDKDKTIDIIKENSDKFSIYAIGVGDEFDEDLIKRAGIHHKGNYSFCKDFGELNSTIVNEINHATKPYINKISIESILDNNIIKIENMPECYKGNEIINLRYLTENNNINLDDKININLKLFLSNNDIIENKYEILPEKLDDGDELSKLIINKYLLNEIYMDYYEKIKMALKYQILTNNTSLFAVVELNEKIQEELKTEILGEKSANVVFKEKPKEKNKVYKKKEKKKKEKSERQYNYDPDDESDGRGFENLRKHEECYCGEEEEPERKPSKIGKFFKSIGKSISSIFSSRKSHKKDIEDDDNCEACPDDFSRKIISGCGCDEEEEYEDDYKKNEIKEEVEKKEEKKVEEKVEKKVEKEDEKVEKEEEYEVEEIEINEYNDTENAINEEKKDKIIYSDKDEIMEMIRTQNFIEGFWEINDKTKIILDKYEKEFELLMKLENRNIDEKVAITILIIYYIYKEYSGLLNELMLIIQKGKKYINKITKITYEDILKEINCNI